MKYIIISSFLLLLLASCLKGSMQCEDRGAYLMFYGFSDSEKLLIIEKQYAKDPVTRL